MIRFSVTHVCHRVASLWCPTGTPERWTHAQNQEDFCNLHHHEYIELLTTEQNMISLSIIIIWPYQCMHAVSHFLQNFSEVVLQSDDKLRSTALRVISWVYSLHLHMDELTACNV